MAWSDTARAITDRVIQIREEARMNKVDFAEVIGVSKQAYTPYEQYGTEYTLEQIFIISERFKKSVCWILGIYDKFTPEEDELLFTYRRISEDGLRIAALGSVKGLADSSAKSKPAATGRYRIEHIGAVRHRARVVGPIRQA